MGKTRNSIVFKILTSNPYGLKILQTLFAKPAPVKPFQGVRGRGVPLTTPNFPKWTSPEHPLESCCPTFFSLTYPQDIFNPHA